MKMKLFNYAILYHPPGEKTQIIKPITPILAADESQAKILVGREIPNKYLDKLGEVEMVIRPF